MSADDNFLARWSRRKREVEEVEKPPPPLRGRAGEEGEPQPQHPLPSPTLDPSPQSEGESAAPVQPLPSLDDLTAEDNLSAFLRQGVPEALKKAALRRMWSLDPAIRDHVGLAEYAWDFNDPASIPGFGTVAAGTPMAQLAAQVMSGQGKAAEAPSVAPQAEAPEKPAAGPLSSLDSAHGPDEDRVQAASPAPAEEHASREAAKPGQAGDRQPARSDRGRREGEPGESAHGAAEASPLRHGGAMPR